MVLDSASQIQKAMHHQHDRTQSRKRDRKTAGLSYEAAASVTSSSDHIPLGSVSTSPIALSKDAQQIRDLSSPPPKLPRIGMHDTYQPWVLQTYGDSAKTKTITKNKYQRILQILRGDYIDNETSKFKLWVKGRGFRIGVPPGYVHGVEGGEVMGGLPSVVGGQTGVDYSPDKDPRPDIFVQTGTVKDSEGNDRISYKKVAIVEDFFDIIYNLHVCKDGKEQKHMGQKRTYRAVSERYAFVPREAVTKFLVLCTECPRRSSGASGGINANLNNNNNINNNNNNLIGDKGLHMNNNNTLNTSLNGINAKESVTPTKPEKRNSDAVRMSKNGSAFQPINSSSRNGTNGAKKYTGIPSSHLSPSSPLTQSHPLSSNSHSFLPMTPTHPTPHNIISFLPSPSPASLSSHSISSMLPDHTSHSAIASQSYNPIDVVNRACINSIGSGSSHSLSSIPSLNSVPHSSLLTCPLSLASPFQLSNPLLQSPLSLSHHLSHPVNLLHSQLTPPLTPIAHVHTESPSKSKVKSPKRSTKVSAQKGSPGSKVSSTVSSKRSPPKNDSLPVIVSPSKTPSLTLCASPKSSPASNIASSRSLLPSIPEAQFPTDLNDRETINKEDITQIFNNNNSPSSLENKSILTSASHKESTPVIEENINVKPSVQVSVINDAFDVDQTLSVLPKEPAYSIYSPKEDRHGFNMKLSDFSSSINYSMPITTIYLKHMRDFEQQKYEEQERLMEMEEERKLQFDAIEVQRIRNEDMIRREHQAQLYLQLQQQQLLQEQQQEIKARQLMALQMHLLQGNATVLSGESITVKTEAQEKPDALLLSSYLGFQEDNRCNFYNGFTHRDTGGLNPNHGDATSAGVAAAGGSAAVDAATATDDSKTEVKTEATRGSEWGQQQNASSKTDAATNAKNSPCPSPSLSDPPASIADDSSTGGGRDEDDDEDDADDDKVDAHHDPERLKAFNMFVRLFVDENLDRMVPISKQPKDKIQAIIDACGRQFPEFSERTRKRIRTYLKSCRRNKRTRDSNGWESGRPTPPHLTSLQAEQLLATACENEAQNAKRMRLGLDPVAQPHPYQQQQPAIAVVGTDKGVTFMDVSTVVTKTEVAAKPQVVEGRMVNGTSGGGMVGVTAGGVTVFQPAVTNLPSSTSSQCAPAYHQSLQQAYQKVTNGPTDLSMRTAVATSSIGGPLMSSGASAPSSVPPSLATGNNIITNNNNSVNGVTSNSNMIGVNSINNGISMASSATVVNSIGSGGVVVTNNPAAGSHTSNSFGAPCPMNMSNSNVVASTPAVAPSAAAAPPASGKSRPSLSPVEVAAVRQLITGYRESAAFLLRSAEELQNLIHQQNS